MRAAHRDATGPWTRRPGVRAGLAVAGLGAMLGGAALLARRCLLHVTVHGDSMAPHLVHGDSALVLRSPPAVIRRGQVVVGITPEGYEDPELARPPYFVKRVAGVGGDRVRRPDGKPLTVPAGAYYVRGQAELSVDSGVWGPVDRSRVLGVVLGRLSRANRR